MKRALLIAGGTVGGLGAVLSVTPPQLGSDGIATLAGASAATSIPGATGIGSTDSAAVASTPAPAVTKADTTANTATTSTAAKKKVVSKTRLSINENYSLRHLYYGGTGAAGYILRPSGAKALLNTEYKNGYALTDSQICRTLFKNPYQLDHAAIIQLDCCERYLIKNEFKPLSNLRRQRDKYHYKFWVRYKFKRLISQFKQSKRYLKILLPDIERTEIKPLLSSFSKNFKK